MIRPQVLTLGTAERSDGSLGKLLASHTLSVHYRAEIFVQDHIPPKRKETSHDCTHKPPRVFKLDM